MLLITNCVSLTGPTRSWALVARTRCQRGQVRGCSFSAKMGRSEICGGTGADGFLISFKGVDSDRVIRSQLDVQDVDFESKGRVDDKLKLDLFSRPSPQQFVDRAEQVGGSVVFTSRPTFWGMRPRCAFC